NLPTLERHELRRGDALVAPGHYPVSYRLDARLDVLGELPAAVTVHLGTIAVPARVARAGSYAQLRLSEPAGAPRGDRFVLPPHPTVAGGVVLDPAPPRGLDLERMKLLERGDPAAIVAAIVDEPVSGAELQARGLLAPHELAEGLAGVEAAGDHYFSADWLASLRAHGRPRLAQPAASNPVDPRAPPAELVPPAP